MTHHVQQPSTSMGHVVTPADLDEALRWMAMPNTRAIAGGTDLMIELDRGQHGEVETLVDITRLPGLDEIGEADGTVTIGPLVTHNQVVASELLRRHAVPLVQASWEVGSPQLRNRATVAGNIVTASPANDTLSPLVALEASVTVTSRTGSRTIPLSEFHLGVRRTAIADDELLTAITFPALDDSWRGLYLKLGLRRAQAISVVHLAVVAKLGPGTSEPSPVVEEIRIALGSVAPTIVRATDAEARLVGAALDTATIAEAAELVAASVQPIDDLRATAQYRSDVLSDMVRRALAALGQDAAVLPTQPPLLRKPGADRWPNGSDFGAEHRVDSVVSATVNGSTVSGPAGGSSTLDWLRSQGLTGVKEGCAEGECGSCTIDMDGMAVLSCLVPASRAHNTSITTIEGLADREDLHPLQQAFIDAGAVQCGFCIPGLLMSGATLLEEHPEPSQDQIKSGLAGNLCRCTGYYKIEEALRVAAGNGSSDR